MVKNSIAARAGNLNVDFRDFDLFFMTLVPLFKHIIVKMAPILSFIFCFLCKLTHHIFKNKGEGFPGVYNVMQSNYIRVLQLLEERRFSNGRERGAFLLLQTDFLQSHWLASQTATE
jgi:hypothetical protein